MINHNCYLLNMMISLIMIGSRDCWKITMGDYLIKKMNTVQIGE